jgi:hypothetical protein
MPQLPPEVVAVDRLLKEAGGSTGGWDDADHERCVFVCVCVCVCVCERERERERERENECVCPHTTLSIITMRQHAHAREGAPHRRTGPKRKEKKRKKGRKECKFVKQL